MVQVGEGVHSGTALSAGDKDPDHRIRQTKVLQIYVYWTKSASSCTLMLQNYAWKACRMLRKHGLELRGHPGLPTGLGANHLQLDWTADITLHDHKEQIMELSQKLEKTPDNALPVILCTITDDVGDNGEKLIYKGRPFVLIYGNHPSADKVTLLHEIGHAAHCANHPPWGLGRPDKRYNFMATPAEFPPGSKELEMTKDPKYYRNTIFKSDVIRFSVAPFSVLKGLCEYPPLF